MHSFVQLRASMVYKDEEHKSSQNYMSPVSNKIWIKSNPLKSTKINHFFLHCCMSAALSLSSSLPAPLREEKASLSKRTHRCATRNAETADISSRSRLTLPLLLILRAGKDSVLSITSGGMCQDHHPSTVQDESGNDLTFKSSKRVLGRFFLN